MSEKTIAWLRGKITESSAPAVLEAGEIGANVAALAETVSSLRAGGTMLFGLQVPGDVLETVGHELIAQADAALAEWKRRLEHEFGAEGHDAFRTIALRYGVMLEEAAPLRRDPDVSRSLSRLFAALDDLERATRNARAAHRWVYEDADRLAYQVVQNPDPIGFAQLVSELGDVPPQLEGLYAELDELVIGADQHGGRRDHRVDDYSLIEPVERAEVLDIEGAECVRLHHQDMGRMLLVRVSDGAVLEWIAKFEEHPKVVAPSLATYFDQLATLLSA